jgi:L,D-transpeptidase ErfK/SrfK
MDDALIVNSMLKHLLFLCLALLYCGGARGQEPPRLSSLISGGEFVHTVKRGDSLTSVGARFGVAPATMARANDLPVNARLKEGQPLRIDNRHIVPAGLQDGILINIPQRMLFYFKEGRLLHFFPVGLGRPDWPTPTANFTVRVKEEDPVWDVPPSIQEEMRREGTPVLTCVPPGPENPLGKHWLGLSLAGYGIHGTNAPASIYQFRTHGCIRLHPDDMAELFAAVAPGTRGAIVYRRLLLAKVGEQIFLEVHPDVYGKELDALKQLRQIGTAQALTGEIDWHRAEDVIRRQDGIARLITKGASSEDAAQ